MQLLAVCLGCGRQLRRAERACPFCAMPRAAVAPTAPSRSPSAPLALGDAPRGRRDRRGVSGAAAPRRTQPPHPTRCWRRRGRCTGRPLGRSTGRRCCRPTCRPAARRCRSPRRAPVAARAPPASERAPRRREPMPVPAYGVSPRDREPWTALTGGAHAISRRSRCAGRPPPSHDVSRGERNDTQRHEEPAHPSGAARAGAAPAPASSGRMPSTGPATSTPGRRPPPTVDARPRACPTARRYPGRRPRAADRGRSRCDRGRASDRRRSRPSPAGRAGSRRGPSPPAPSPPSGGCRSTREAPRASA